jgi:glc operon protein GlcG
MALIARNRVRLTIEGARAVLDAARRKAEEMKIPMNIAVVDDGGHLLAFERMDGAKPASIAISMVKAQAAAMRCAATGPARSPDGVNLPVAFGLAVASPSEQTPIRGGFPLVVDSQVIGAIGVSAGNEDEDSEVARAGVAVIEKM